jgi:ankyrin repeat protein
MMQWWLRRSWNAKVIEAICLGDRECLQELHRRGIRMNARSKVGESYLHRVAAIRLGWAGAMAETLIELGADVNAAMALQSRPLHTATIAGNLDAMESLLNHSADIDARNAYGFTPLHYAVSNDEIEIVKLLLGRGANATVKTRVGDTPLAIAQRNQAWDIANLLWDFQTISHSTGGLHARFHISPADTRTFH